MQLYIYYLIVDQIKPKMSEYYSKMYVVPELIYNKIYMNSDINDQEEMLSLNETNDYNMQNDSKNKLKTELKDKIIIDNKKASTEYTDTTPLTNKLINNNSNNNINENVISTALHPKPETLKEIKKNIVPKSIDPSKPKLKKTKRKIEADLTINPSSKVKKNSEINIKKISKKTKKLTALKPNKARFIIVQNGDDEYGSLLKK